MTDKEMFDRIMEQIQKLQESHNSIIDFLNKIDIIVINNIKDDEDDDDINKISLN